MENGNKTDFKQTRKSMTFAVSISNTNSTETNWRCYFRSFGKGIDYKF